MSILFECQCGKRLKAREEIAGRPAKCPQCGRMNLVPRPLASAPPPPNESDTSTPFVLVLDDGLTGPQSIALADHDQPFSPPLDAALIIDPTDSPSDEHPSSLDTSDDSQPSTTPTLAELSAASAESPPTIKPSRTRLGPAEPPLGREPWYVAWAAAVARAVMAAALSLSVLVPAFFLVGGLLALVQTGSPRTLLSWRIATIPLAAALAALWSIFAILALLWAAPVLMLVDQSRRLRILMSRLDTTRVNRPPPTPESIPGHDDEHLHLST